MLQIYKVFVRPNLEYAVAAWSPWLIKDIKCLELVQKRATRRISDIRGSYEERLSQLGLTTLEERRKRGDAIEIYKYLHNIWDIDSTTMILRAPENRPRTRQQVAYVPLDVPFARLEIRKNFFPKQCLRINMCE
jgi:ribonuclease P/MRP protein subunit RPP40